MANPDVQKAKIVNLSDESKVVVCHFNPAEFDVTQSVRWEGKSDQGGSAPNMVFAGGEASSMTITFLFDTTKDGGKKDVRDTYGALLDMAQAGDSSGGQGEPPQCRFQWGKFLTFNAVIKDIKQKFTLFAPDGTPLRAEVAVTFKQVGQDTKPQNPTSRSQARRVWTVEEGQRLDWIAYKEYGDPAQWRHIAETNDLDHPGQVYSGQILKLTPLL